MLRDVGRVVKYLLGEFYRPYYLSKHFRNIIKRAVTQHEAEEKEIPIRENRKRLIRSINPCLLNL